MPFAVANPVLRATQAALVFDVRRLNGARAYLDLAPGPEEMEHDERANSHRNAGCAGAVRLQLIPRLRSNAPATKRR